MHDSSRLFPHEICDDFESPIGDSVMWFDQNFNPFARSFDDTLQYMDRMASPIGKIVKRYGSWAVTENGVECLIYPFVIEKSRMDEGDWISYVLQKPWVAPMPFIAAFSSAYRLYVTDNNRTPRPKPVARKVGKTGKATIDDPTELDHLAAQNELLKQEIIRLREAAVTPSK